MTAPRGGTDGADDTGGFASLGEFAGAVVAASSEGGFLVPPEIVEVVRAAAYFDFTLWIGRALVRAKLFSLSDVAAKTDAELLALPGIGPVRLRQIRARLEAEP